MLLVCREEDGFDLNHGTNVLVDLICPLANSDRVIVADSYFASVQAAKVLFGMGLRFIGTVKTATRAFPMHFLQRVQMPNGKGDHKALLAKDQETGTFLMALYGLIETVGTLFRHVLLQLLALSFAIADGDREILLLMLMLNWRTSESLKRKLVRRFTMAVRPLISTIMFGKNS